MRLTAQKLQDYSNDQGALGSSPQQLSPVQNFDSYWFPVLCFITNLPVDKVISFLLF